ncbi:MAG: hypothetical protein EOP87_03615 [Verrucomicrobiaceae bacterium]|nr:MAG: hypothetical protein EOP87_03615 [Verrucomicrobiaceae bacterium]
MVLTDYQNIPLVFGNWLSGRNIADKTPAGNSDQDAFNNLLEYALGLDPSVADGGGAILSGVMEISGERFLTLSFVRPSGNARPSDLSYAAERSSLLGADWSIDGVTLQQTVTVPEGEKMTYRSSTPISSSPKEFLRLKVTLAPSMEAP